MRPIVTAAEMRAAEQAVWAEDPGADLMARAARAVVEEVARLTPRRVLVVAGSGNNGGDGLFAAAELAQTLPVMCWLPLGAAHPQGLAAARAAGAVVADEAAVRAELSPGTVVLDAFTGLGSRPGLPDDVAAVARAAAEAGATVVSVDLPSGLDADSPEAHPSFAADVTVTFAAAKPCHECHPAAARCGRVVVADIGVAVNVARAAAVEERDLSRWWRTPDASSDKYSRGVVLLDTGSERFPGAAVLTAAGALHAGAGLVRYVGPAVGQVLARYPSVVAGWGRAQAVVIGSGWGAPDAARARAAADTGLPVVADAEAIQSLPEGRHANWLITPHAGELARLLGVERRQVERDPMGSARLAAMRTGATCLLKGGTQYVARPDGVVTVALGGVGWSAVAGSGDVLAGICGALLAQGLAPWQAATAGASVQALAARRHPGPYPPDSAAAFLPGVIAELAG
ncbi:NAD(P)H-hydrate epimerase [Tessaracoccus sp. OH4464_COT-324]|uniref:NAD(P)H-hydrate epimerase n=1 Tax=Tessaracoccus sp. OH4464_COT-324 TaxID=2491059 RepID=UPI000F6437DB|nr:NAD(P)H-hydrate epimerase [Tessaracoccus sp. OH4464_COT-324]RRD46579.1 NAD(P)H-hydrate epimerase [Tessaracoccus sp. OH4464_COT-324]